ncbi:hypothetical protein OEZ86_013167 [Tetradesmus obliquus]|nr:hypothetical protein OEZ86_013167 [Tetradesmus obliquus]
MSGVAQGLDDGAFSGWYSSAKLAGADLYTAGAAIVWLKQLGPWSDADVANRLIPCYPEEMLWEFPGLLADFRAEQLPLIKRMVQSRRDKYSQGGFYSD